MARRDDWETPEWLFLELHREFSFDLDAAARADNTKCPRFLSDALGVPWPGRSVFLNPPYGPRHLEMFLRKAIEQADAGRTVVCLIPPRTETGWWHELVLGRANELRFVRGRVAFKPPRGHVLSPRGNRPVFNSCVVVFRPTPTPLRVSSMEGRRNSRLRTSGRQPELVMGR